MTMALVSVGVYLNFGLNRWRIGSLIARRDDASRRRQPGDILESAYLEITNNL